MPPRLGRFDADVNFRAATRHRTGGWREDPAGGEGDALRVGAGRELGCRTGGLREARLTKNWMHCVGKISDRKCEISPHHSRGIFAKLFSDASTAANCSRS